MTDINEDIEAQVQRYVLSLMSEAEALEFEERFLGDTELTAKVEQAQSINLGFSYAEQMGDLGRISAPLEKSLFSKVLDWISIPVPVYALVLFGLLMAPLVSVFEQSNSEEIDFVGFSTETTRGASMSKIVKIPERENVTALLIKVKKPSHKMYRIEVFDADSSRELWNSHEFQLDALRSRAVVLPKSLANASLEIKVTGKENSGDFSVVEYCHYSEVCN